LRSRWHPSEAPGWVHRLPFPLDTTVRQRHTFLKAPLRLDVRSRPGPTLVAFSCTGEATQVPPHGRADFAIPMIARESPASLARCAGLSARKDGRPHLQALRYLQCRTACLRLRFVRAGCTGAGHARRSVAYPRWTALLGMPSRTCNVCTSAGMHFEAGTRRYRRRRTSTLKSPSSIPRTKRDVLLRLAAGRNRLVCAGHQLLWDRAFRMVGACRRARPMRLVDSHFHVQPFPAAPRSGGADGRWLSSS